MALSACESCWNTPCTCGHAWRNATAQQRYVQAALILGVTVEELKTAIQIPTNHPGERKGLKDKRNINNDIQRMKMAEAQSIAFQREARRRLRKQGAQ